MIQSFGALLIASTHAAGYSFLSASRSTSTSNFAVFTFYLFILVLPCTAAFFRELVQHLYKDRNRFGRFPCEEFVKMLSDVGSGFCKETTVAFALLLQKAKGLKFPHNFFPCS